MNTLLASTLALAAFTFAAACSTPVPPAADKVEDNQTESDATSDEDDDDSAPASSTRTDAGPRPTTTAPPRTTSPEAGAPAKDDSKGDATCASACDSLEQCDDVDFCKDLCTDAPEVVRCLVSRNGCSKQDFIACDNTEDNDKGDDDGNIKGGK